MLVDSGGFFGASYVPVGGEALVSMLDEHVYPPCPLPPDELARMRTLAAHDGPSFVSEYGYGALLDTQRAAVGFHERLVLGAERALFDGMDEVARRALAAGDGWAAEGWLEPAQRLHAEMSARMTEALRSNPRLDMLCYTQWRAVSHEASAGLLAPWGERRPAFGAMQQALRPLLVAVFPRRPSVRAGDGIGLEVAVVNDTGTPVAGELVVVGRGAAAPPGQSARTWSLGAGPWPVGVSVRRIDVPTDAACSIRDAVFVAALRGEVDGVDGVGAAPGGVAGPGGAVADESRPTRVVVVSPPASDLGPVLVVPDADERLLAFAERERLPVVSSFAEAGERRAVAVLGSPEDLAGRVRIDQRLELWRSVWVGGTAVILLNPPPPSDIGRLAGRTRGTRTLLHVPLRLGVSSAAGNFLGRLHVALVLAGPFGARVPDPLVLGVVLGVAGGAGASMLEIDDGVLTPATMVVGPRSADARASFVTLGHFGQRLGDDVVQTPYGKGQLVLIGLPLLEPVAGVADPRRDRALSHLLRQAAEATRPGPLPGPDAGPAFGELAQDATEASQIEHALGRIERVVAFWDRHSAAFGGESGGVRRPEELWQALAWKHEGLLSYARGDRKAGRAHMLAAYQAIWNDDVAAMLALDEAVLAMVHELLERGEYADLDLAYQALQAWRNGLQFWSQGDRSTGLSWLGSARLLLVESGRVTVPEDENHESVPPGH